MQIFIGVAQLLLSYPMNFSVHPCTSITHTCPQNAQIPGTASRIRRTSDLLPSQGCASSSCPALSGSDAPSRNACNCRTRPAKKTLRRQEGAGNSHRRSSHSGRECHPWRPFSWSVLSTKKEKRIKKKKYLVLGHAWLSKTVHLQW